ncbi:hypothetical protein BACCELL_05613, partial [Bacteroides cellulosilyticus DSM 14838]
IRKNKSRQLIRLIICGKDRTDRKPTYGFRWVPMGFALRVAQMADNQRHLPGCEQLLRTMITDGFQFHHQRRTIINPAHQAVGGHSGC